MIRLDDELHMKRLAWDGYTLRVDATLVGTAPMLHDHRRHSTPAPATPLDIAADHLRSLPGVGPYTDLGEILDAHPLGVEGTLFSIAGDWRPVMAGKVDRDGNIYEMWGPQFDEWSAAGTLFLDAAWWTPDALRERVERAGEGRWRVAAWDVSGFGEGSR